MVTGKALKALTHVQYFTISDALENREPTRRSSGLCACPFCSCNRTHLHDSAADMVDSLKSSFDLLAHKQFRSEYFSARSSRQKIEDAEPWQRGGPSSKPRQYEANVQRGRWGHQSLIVYSTRLSVSFCLHREACWGPSLAGRQSTSG